VIFEENSSVLEGVIKISPRSFAGFSSEGRKALTGKVISSASPEATVFFSAADEVSAKKDKISDNDRHIAGKLFMIFPFPWKVLAAKNNRPGSPTRVLPLPDSAPDLTGTSSARAE
jgi:hypothetical protein